MSGKAGRSSRRGRTVAQVRQDPQGREADQGLLSAKREEFNRHQEHERQDAGIKEEAEGFAPHSSLPAMALGKVDHLSLSSFDLNCDDASVSHFQGRDRLQSHHEYNFRSEGLVHDPTRPAVFGLSPHFS